MKIFTNIMIKHLETCDKKKPGSAMENNSCDEENSATKKDTSRHIKKYACTKCDQTFSRESSMYLLE